MKLSVETSKFNGHTIDFGRYGFFFYILQLRCNVTYVLNFNLTILHQLHRLPKSYGLLHYPSLNHIDQIT